MPTSIVSPGMRRVSLAVPLAFNVAMAVILVWVVSGPIYGFSDTWQLVINTATTIVTFLIVFLIQHTQNREHRGSPGQVG
jgi:low affinity Fe/Cu permease